MPHFDQSHYELRCEWGLNGVRHLAAADVIIVVDVLSFTTSVDVAVGRGAVVLPYRWNDASASSYASEMNATLAVPRSRKEDAYSLAPSSLINVPAGLRLVLPSPNGSNIAFAASDRGAMVAAGCLRNASAVAKWATKMGKRIAVIPAGERWPDGSLRPAVEDLIGAGAILTQLPGSRSPEADIAVACFERSSNHLREKIFATSSGRELVERGYQCDLDIAVEFDVSAVVPVLETGAFVSGND